ncbi:reverse transcriptase domain-containing protein [Tanacetum coccineum]
MTVSTLNMFEIVDISGLNLTVGHPNGTLAKIKYVGDNPSSEGNIPSSSTQNNQRDLLENVSQVRPTIRKSSRSGKMSAKFNDYVVGSSVKYGIEKFVESMNNEIEVLNRNHTWTVCDLLEGRKSIDFKWLFKIKCNVFIVVLVYVDDVVIARNNVSEIEKFKLFLKSKLQIKDLGKLKYFLGIEVLDNKDGSPGNGVQINKSGNLKLRAYADSDGAICLVTKKSMSGYCVFLGVKDLLHVVLYCENSSTLQIAANPVFHEKSKHFELDVHLVLSNELLSPNLLEEMSILVLIDARGAVHLASGSRLTSPRRRDTLGKEPVPQDPGRLIFNEALREYCDRNYHQILPIIAEKVHQEKVQQEKLKEVIARLNFEETSRHSESGTPIKRRGLKERLGPRHVRSRSGSPEPRHDRPESPKNKGSKRKAVFKRLEKGVFHRLGDKGKSVSVHSDDSRRWSHHSSRRDTESCHQNSRSRATESASERHYTKRASSRRTKELSESEGNPFTPRIRYFDFPKTRMPSHIKTYNGSEDPEDHLKIFQSAAKTERWAMPTWCHMFNSTLIGKARKKCIKDPVKIHNIRQRDGESTEEFVQRYKLECMDVKRAPECMKISRFMHGITNPELIKRLHDKILKSVNEMMRVTTAFLRGEVAASNREQKKPFSSWKQQEANQKQNFKKGGYRNQQRSERNQDRFSLLTKTPK